MSELGYKRLQSRVTEKMYKKMRRIVKKREISDSHFIRELILAEIKKEEEKNGYREPN